LSRFFPLRRSPSSDDKGSSSYRRSLLKLLTTSGRPTRRSDLLPGISCPFSDIARTSPIKGGIPTPPRFHSQVFSTSQRFPGRSKFRGLVSSRCRSWDSPFRVFPSQESRAPFEAALLPCGYPPTCWTPPPEPCPPVSPTPTLTRSCLVPPALWDPFSRAETRFPVTLGPIDRTRPFRQLHPLRSLDPPPSPFTPTLVAPS
jgi:hypothetical protein